MANHQTIRKTHAAVGHRAAYYAATARAGGVFSMGGTVFIAPIILQVAFGEWFVTHSTIGNKGFLKAGYMPGLTIFFYILTCDGFLTACAQETVVMPDLIKGSHVITGNGLLAALAAHGHPCFESSNDFSLVIL
nr:hypothetical protein [Sansalvadorimonas verongulae]